MLSTLLKIGEQLLEGKGIWSRLTVEPKVDEEDKNRWICPILFDCIDCDIKILDGQLERFYPNESAIDLRYVNTDLWGRRGKKCALTVENKNFSMLPETFFGKEKGSKGSMQESIKEFNENLTSSEIYIALNEINTNLKKLKENLDIKKIKEQIKLSNKDEIVLYYSLVRSTKIRNAQVSRLTELKGFEDFIIGKFSISESGKKGLDYITGEYVEQVGEANFTGRYNIHKIFQTTTFNYASGFSDFNKNFQTNSETIASLDKASSYLLKKQTRIAGISHIIIPNFLNKDLKEINIDQTELFLETSSDLLFQARALDTRIKKELPDMVLFWVNYLGFESDGNSFKIINLIKDVNSLHLRNVIDAFNKAQVEFYDYIGGKYAFNLQSIYNIIPVREGKKEKKNEALAIFKDILEQRMITTSRLFKHFINLILCHWYNRYKAFPNIWPNESFDFAIKDAVYKYSALIYTLTKLNILIMEETQPTIQALKEGASSDIQQRLNDFFSKMSYTAEQKSLFYLGRVLSAVAYAQYKKGHESKPVLNKINFNGMDASSLIRFSLDLAEKARQYNIHSKTDWDFARFRENFNEKNWVLTPEQSVFYIMAGYSFGLTKSENN